MPDTLILSVPDMTCDHCEAAVKHEVGAVAGVSAVDVDLITKVVTVEGADLHRPAILEAIDEAGFDVA